MSARGRRKNLSFFAFTATPKFRTLEMFGTPDAEGKPRPFHLYSMRQAIEEEFILDVLASYTTYKTFFRIAKRITDDPELDKKKAAGALMRYISGHPHNIAEKTKVMVEHFYHTTRTLLDGRAKAMVVTASRLHAVKYYFAFQSYIKERGYQNDVNVLVAFSGKVVDPDTGAEHSEASLNGFSDNEIPEQFKGAYNVLIVAYKFQTGFDQPLLHTMYVDQMLRGVKAVQTLSRLNRIFPGKRGTFVLDFRNEAGDIRDAFEPYYVSSTVDEATDPNDLYDYKAELDSYQVYWPQEVENFAREFFKPGRKKTGSEQARMHGTSTRQRNGLRSWKKKNRTPSARSSRGTSSFTAMCRTSCGFPIPPWKWFLCSHGFSEQSFRKATGRAPSISTMTLRLNITGCRR
jgi:type I restriction enzyme R subunit